MLAPVVLFVYNRPEHTRQTLGALSRNTLADQTVLYIYADGPKPNATAEELKQISEVRQLIRSSKWCGEVHIKEQELNKGLADSIIMGVTETVNNHGKVIVLEDDIVTSPGFLTFMNNGLTFYKNEERVMHISAYFWPSLSIEADTLFVQNAGCWGWGTWQRAWKKFDPDAQRLYDELVQQNEIENYKALMWGEPYKQLMQNIERVKKTWAVKWNTSIYLNKGLCLHPNKSFVNNIGNDGTGTNQDVTDFYYCKNLAVDIPVRAIALQNTEIDLVDQRYTQRNIMKPTIKDRILMKITNAIKRAL